MSVAVSGIGRQTLVYGFGILLSKGVSFLMLPIYTRYLTPADYGVMELIAMTLDVISIVAGARLALGVFRYYHKAETDAERSAVVSTAMVTLGASYAVVGAIAFVSADALASLVFRTREHATLIRLASATLAVQSCLLVPLSYARLKDRAALYVRANLAKLAIALTLNLVLLVGLEMGVRAVFIAELVATAAVGLVLVGGMFREVGIAFSRAATRDLLRYGAPLMGTQVASFIATFGDRFFLQRHGSTTDVGLYSLAYQFGFLLATVGYIPFANVWEPARFRIAKQPEAERDALLSKGFIYMNVALVTLAVGMSLFVGDALRIMATPDFVRAASVVPIILAAYVLQCWASVQDLGIHMRERTGFIALANWASAAVAVLGYWLLIPRWLGTGAAVATLLAFAVRYGITYGISQRLWRVQYQWSPIVLLSGLAVFIVVAGELLPTMRLAASLAARATLFAIYVSALWTSSILTADDRLRARDLLRGARALVPTLASRRAAQP